MKILPFEKTDTVVSSTLLTAVNWIEFTSSEKHEDCDHGAFLFIESEKDKAQDEVVYCFVAS